jgi:3-dehydro-L-gulonate 2-dehydrogenase
MSFPKIVRVPFDEMKGHLYQVLLSLNFSEINAEKCAAVFAENSLDGIYSHGVNRFPRFVEYIKKGHIDPKASPVKVWGFGNMEQWDGQLGPGPTNALAASERAMELAAKHGLGMVAMANTNHWMRGGSYGWKCANEGFVFVGWTNTIANMPAWGAKENKLGNNPLVIAIPYRGEALVLDMALSQFSYGKMEDMANTNEKLPVPGGSNKAGELTNDPREILESYRALPIGYWKGTGLSLMLDVMATVLSAGLSTAAVTNQNKDEFGVSQIFIAIDLKQLPTFSAIDRTIQEMIADFLSAETITGAQSIRYPGQKIVATREENRQKGIPVKEEIWEMVLGM